MIWIRFFSCL